MPSLYGNLRLLMGVCHGLLHDRDGRRRLEIDLHLDVRPVADAAEDPAGMICLFPDPGPVHAERIVVFAAEKLRGAGALPDIKTLHGPDGEHGFGQVCIQLLKYRVSEPCRQAFYGERHRASNGIALRPALIEQLPYRRLVSGIHISDADHARLTLDSQLFQHFKGNRTAGHAAARLTAG